MKRILTTITALCIACTAFAGKGFRTIHFTSYWTETQKSGLDMQFGSSPVSGPSQYLRGGIAIDTEDSTFSITAPGAAPTVYKLTEVGEVNDDKQRSYEEVILQIQDKAGAKHRVAVQRHYDLRFVKVFIFNKGSDSYLVYGCDYLKKLK